MTYDPAKDHLTVTVSGAVVDPKSAKSAQKSLNLLLDANGHLVGIDLGGSEAARWVVMLGKHEDVAGQREGRGEVWLDGAGAPLKIVLFEARAAVRAHERNPHL